MIMESVWSHINRLIDEVDVNKHVAFVSDFMFQISDFPEVLSLAVAYGAWQTKLAASSVLPRPVCTATFG